MLSHKEPDKARHYLDLLDTARCDGQWHEVPELVRKIRKHAPHRHCLIVTAQTEPAVAEQFSKQKDLISRPAQTSPTTASLYESIPALVNARDQEVNVREDAFQAQICLAWLYITLGQIAQALSAVPSGLDQASERFAQEGGITGRWTHVCLVKGAYIRGVSLEKEGKMVDAFRTYESMLPYFSNIPSTFANTTQHHYWREMVLARYSMLSSRHVIGHAGNPIDLLSPGAPIPPASLLTPFRAYAQNWDSKLSARAGISFPLRLWQAYYDTLSILIQLGIVQPMFKSRLQQSTELKSVETIYEDGLLKTVTFPRADQTSPHVESWVDQVMANWRIMCGSSWQEEEIGEGGRAALSNGVLEILYRAASKTFHSTRVLRHLFTVHTALADFYLASKALDSYLEILVKGKARVEKSGEEEVSLDSDATALSTAAAGIKMLCNYGRRKEVEKSLNVANVVEGWLDKLHTVSSPKPVVSAEDVPRDLVEQPRIRRPAVPGQAIALGYHALGVSQSCWARLTYETSSRAELQDKALANLRTALDPKFGEERNVEIRYSLSFVLAETRDLDAAIASVKRALSSDRNQSTSNGVFSAKVAFDTERDEDIPTIDQRSLLIKCWHLLALLLSARQNFSTAVASCEAALDLYGGKSILYGDTKPPELLQGLSISEKKAIIEIKMTQLTLTEIIDGPEEAVNSSGELLGLYTKLFKYVDKPAPKVQNLSTSPPSSANGTLRSLRGSILGLSKDQGLKSRKPELSGQTDITTSNSLRSYESPDETIRPPTISITGEDGAIPENPNHHSHLLGQHVSNKLHKKYSHKLVASRRLSRNASPSRPATSDGARHHLSLNLPHRNRHTEPTAIDGSDSTSNSNSTHYASDEVGVAISHDLPSTPASPAATSDPANPLHAIPSTTQNMNHRNPNTHPPAPKPPPSQHNRITPIVLPSALAPLPEPHYPPADESRHALTLLTKIWLLISTLYRRASMPIDAQGALSEATTHVQSIENSIVTHDGSSAESFSTPGYGGLKSSDELQADVLAEQAALHQQLGKLDLASKAYESALGYWPDHVDATVGLCDLLLDEYAAPPTTAPRKTSTPTLGSLPTARKPAHAIPMENLLPKLAARDRAYGLLSALTKSGQGWDCSEAWLALARAYEESGQVEKAKEALWWVVELEEGRGVRGWDCVG